MGLLFRAQASGQEKFFIIAAMFWIGLLVFGKLYYWDVGFGFEPDKVSLVTWTSLLGGFLLAVPVYRWVPSMPSFSLPKRIVVGSSLLVGICGAVFWTFLNLVGPFVTIEYGASLSGEFVVTQRSHGYKNKGCNHYVWLRDRNSAWLGKVCLGQARWEAVRGRQVLIGTGHRSALGRTIEHLAPLPDQRP